MQNYLLPRNDRNFYKYIKYIQTSFFRSSFLVLLFLHSSLVLVHPRAQFSGHFISQSILTPLMISSISGIYVQSICSDSNLCSSWDLSPESQTFIANHLLDISTSLTGMTKSELPISLLSPHLTSYSYSYFLPKNDFSIVPFLKPILDFLINIYHPIC